MHMKLLQIGPYPPPVGGWSFHIKVFREYLDAAGIVNEVLDIGASRKQPGRQCIDVQGPVDYLRKVWRYCRQNYLLYIHLNGNALTGLVLTLLAQLLAGLGRQKSLLSFHAGVVQRCFDPSLSPQRILARLSFYLASGIVCNSEAVKQELVKLGVPAGKVYPIPCFSMQYVKHEPVLTSAEQHFIASHSPIFSSYIFFRAEYDPATLIEALTILKQRHPGFGIIIIGSLDGAEPYIQQIEALGLQEHILLVGEKSHDNFLSIVEQSHLVIRTPISDGVCSSVMEALALKIPVVASDNHTRPPEVILFEAKNAASLAAQVTATLDDLASIRKGLAGVVRRDAIQEELAFLREFSGAGKNNGRANQ